MYQWMRFLRYVDRRCISLQRQGKLGTYVPLAGQEAAQVGSALALRDQDWLFPTYRDHGAILIAGVPLHQVLLYWMGRVEGNQYPEGVRVLPPAVPIATHLPHAVGAAWAAKLERRFDCNCLFWRWGNLGRRLSRSLQLCRCFSNSCYFFLSKQWLCDKCTLFKTIRNKDSG